ncbi:MAG: hypothetical protein SFY81_14495 [Verrucomicrobiota bacterium]|nr:hypothetical protein [Verrucomicrobiota bacterium]
MAPAETRAVIDVGTNSVKLLIAEVQGRTVLPIFEGSEQTRLGQGFYQTHMLQPEAIKATAHAVQQFCHYAAVYHPKRISIIGTSAARDAVNQKELLSAIENATGIPMTVISGAQEAALAFAGVCTDPRFQDTPLLVVDIGGGSTEFILGKQQKIQYAGSFPMGTVRLMEQFPDAELKLEKTKSEAFDWILTFLKEQVSPHFAPFLKEQKVTLVGTGGTCTIMARVQLALDHYDRAKIESVSLPHAGAAAQHDQLWSMPLQSRMEIPGVPAKRADVILMGSAIMRGIMESFSFPEFFVSMRGLRYAAALSD